MLGTLKNMLSSEVDQVSKLTKSEQHQQPQKAIDEARSGRSDSVNSTSTYRKDLLEVENLKKEQARILQEREREFAIQVQALQLENSKLRGENERLHFEPKKARDSMIFLLVALSSAFTLVCFALFAMAERQLQHKSWEEHLQGVVLMCLGCTLIFGAVPLTHMSGQYLFGRLGFKFYQPGQGGSMYIFLQIMGWGFYALFLMSGFHALMFQDTVGMVTASGVMGILSQVVMVSSLLSFRPAMLESGDGYSSGGSTNYTSDGDDSVGTPARIARRKHKRQKSADLSGSQSAELGNEFDFWLDEDSSWNVNTTVKMDTGTALFGVFMLLQSTLVLISVALGFISERASFGKEHRMVLVSLSVLLIVFAAFLTHGLGGSLSKGASWKFFRPFRGGIKFLLLQGVVWGIFTLAVCSNLSVLGLPIYIAKFFSFNPGMTLTYTGLVAVCGHFLSVVSISYYKEQTAEVVEGIPAELAQAARDYNFTQVTDIKLMREFQVRMEKFRGIRSLIGMAIIAGLCNTQYVIFVYATVIFYGPWPLSCLLSDRYCTEMPEDIWPALVKFSVCICVFTIGYSTMKTFNIKGTMRILGMILLTAIPVSWTLYCHHGTSVEPFLRVMCVLFIMYNFQTYSGTPELTGCREWPAFRNFLPFWDLYQDYQGIRLFKDETLKEFEKNDGGNTLGSAGSSVKQAIWGFHPHGIFPTNVIGIPNMRTFVESFGEYKPTPMTATIIHLTPIMRDVAQWAGVRDVGRATVAHALKTGKSPLIVVGGMSEMFESKSWLDEIAVHRGHRGFVRMAIKYGIPLVPMFSFGEHKSMDNIYWPSLQDYCKARLGFPIPYFPYGRWYLPISRRTPITMVVGAPIPIKKQNDNPTKDEIEEVHSRYFDALEDLFERNKKMAGFEGSTIQWCGVKPKVKAA